MTWKLWLTLALWSVVGLPVFLSEWKKVNQIALWQKCIFFTVTGPLAWFVLLVSSVVNWEETVGDFFLFLFCWSGTRLFKVVSIYSPDDELIHTIHFSLTEQALKESCEKLVDEMREIK